MSKQELKVFPGAVACEEAILKGDITIGPGCVIHPKAFINAEAGPIVLGESCIVEEYAQIIYRVPENEEPSPNGLIIGSNNVFEVGCTVVTTGLGDNNVFEPKCVIPADVSIGNGCVIGASCELKGPLTLSDNTVVYGKKCNMKESLDKQPSQNMQLDFLTKVLPNYHRIRRPNQEQKRHKHYIPQ